jgi:hypothetical protein
MSHLRYLCLFAHSGVQHMLCCIFCFVYLRLVSCVPNVPNISGLPILDCLFEDFSNVYLKCMDYDFFSNLHGSLVIKSINYTTRNKIIL